MMSKTFDSDANGPGSKHKVETNAAGGWAARVPLDRVGEGFKDTSSSGFTRIYGT